MYNLYVHNILEKKILTSTFYEEVYSETDVSRCMNRAVNNRMEYVRR